MEFIKALLNKIKDFFLNKGLIKTGFLIASAILLILGKAVWSVLLLGAFLGANYEWIVNKIKEAIKI